MKVALPDGAALGRLRAQQPPALAGDGDVLAAVGPSALDHQATVDGAMHRTPAVGVRKPAGEERQDIGNPSPQSSTMAPSTSSSVIRLRATRSP